MLIDTGCKGTEIARKTVVKCLVWAGASDVEGENEDDLFEQAHEAF